MSFITSPGTITPPLTAGGVAYGTGSQAKMNSAGTAGQVLRSAGAGVPTWATSTTSIPVTVPEGGTGLTTLTANSVILGNGGSAPTFVAPGTVGNVLTSSGTTWSSSALTGSALTLLSTVTANNSATVDVETTFSSTYDVYMIVASAFVPVTVGSGIFIRMKLAGAYVTSATYKYNVNLSSALSSLYVGNADAVATSIQLSNNFGDGDFVVLIYAPSSTARPKFINWSGVGTNNVPTLVTASGVGQNTSTSALTGIRFFTDSGNISSGNFRLYGISN